MHDGFSFLACAACLSLNASNYETQLLAMVTKNQRLKGHPVPPSKELVKKALTLYPAADEAHGEKPTTVTEKNLHTLSQLLTDVSMACPAKFMATDFWVRFQCNLTLQYRLYLCINCNNASQHLVLGWQFHFSVANMSVALFIDVVVVLSAILLSQMVQETARNASRNTASRKVYKYRYNYNATYTTDPCYLSWAADYGVRFSRFDSNSFGHWHWRPFLFHWLAACMVLALVLLCIIIPYRYSFQITHTAEIPSVFGMPTYVFGPIADSGALRCVASVL